MDPVTGARFLSELYLVTDPGYQGKCTLPMLWDTETQRIISNDMAQITIMFETEFTGYHRPGSPDLYPAAMRREIDAVATLIYYAVNIGGDGEPASCECKGHARWSHRTVCKHIACLRALVERGVI